MALTSVAEVALARGYAADMHVAVDEIERIASAHLIESLMPQVWRSRGDLAFAEGHHGVAENAWQRAAELLLAQQRETEALELRCRRAELHLRAGDVAVAL